jgi:hypothetical protein
VPAASWYVDRDSGTTAAWLRKFPGSCRTKVKPLSPLLSEVQQRITDVLTVVGGGCETSPSIWWKIRYSSRSDTAATAGEMPITAVSGVRHVLEPHGSHVT